MTNAERADVAEAKRIFSYNKKTGLLRWKINKTSELKNHLQIMAKAGDVAGWADPNGYRHVMLRGRKRLATWVIWMIVHGRYPLCTIDHRNLVTGDDRIKNLREATHREQRYNCGIRSNNISGHKGVSWSNQKGQWRATIKSNGKQVHLGFFADAARAGAAYRKAAPIYHGEFARVR